MHQRPSFHSWQMSKVTGFYGSEFFKLFANTMQELKEEINTQNFSYFCWIKVDSPICVMIANILMETSFVGQISIEELSYSMLMIDS